MKELLRLRLLEPVLAQLRQGATPEKIALSVAVGVTLGCFPVVGATTALCAAAGLLFGLNHVALQAANYLSYPLQLALIFPFVRLGGLLFGGEPGLSAGQASLWGGLARHALKGTAAWCLVAPLAAAILYRVLLPLARRAVVSPSRA